MLRLRTTRNTVRALGIPTLTSGLAAGLSVLFFIGLSAAFGDRMLGEIILVQAIVQIVVVTCVPQCFVYLLGSRDDTDTAQRYSQGAVAELGGVALALLVLGVGLNLPIPGLSTVQAGAVPMFVSLAVQALGSCQARLRTLERWPRYMLWVLLPNMVRVPLIWATPLAQSVGYLPDFAGDRAAIIVTYFVIPDILRLALIYIPNLVSHFVRPQDECFLGGLRQILRNWWFDIGSALTEIADKIVVGAMLGPELLVVYFFARRIGIVAIMVIEPLYAESFRRMQKIDSSLRTAASELRIFGNGLAMAISLFIVMATLFSGALLVPAVAVTIPEPIIVHRLLFFMVLFFDCVVSANRWSRYAAQLRGKSATLFAIRIMLFSVFTLGVWMFGSNGGGIGIAVAFGIAWALEALVLLRWLSRPVDTPEGQVL
ncbi:hypothetical protein [Sandarakinorhabdus sp. DWP1-3-1]|uniref:hypothetical protein n=1 Tax=Sandarakinorhabdus sp. DWP1-3-1 TaxID=2804627 RepID=UPI003CF5B6C2